MEFLSFVYLSLDIKLQQTNFVIYVLGHEALLLLKLVRKFSEICICIFPPDIVIGRDFCVSTMQLFTLYVLFLLYLQPNFLIPCCLYCRFIYMGFDIAMEQHSWSHIGFIFFSVVSSSCGKFE